MIAMAGSTTQNWQSYLLLLLAIAIAGVGLWMVANGNRAGLAALLFGLFNVLVVIIALGRSK